MRGRHQTELKSWALLSTASPGTTKYEIKSIPTDFVPLQESHTGKYLAKVLTKVLEKHGIKDQVWAIVRDSASNNSAMVDVLQGLVFKCFDGQLDWIRCFAHVFNLTSKATLSPFSGKKEAEDVDSDEEDDNIEDLLNGTLGAITVGGNGKMQRTSSRTVSLGADLRARAVISLKETTKATLKECEPDAPQEVSDNLAKTDLGKTDGTAGGEGERLTRDFSTSGQLGIGFSPFEAHTFRVYHSSIHFDNLKFDHAVMDSLIEAGMVEAQMTDGLLGFGVDEMDPVGLSAAVDGRGGGGGDNKGKGKDRALDFQGLLSLPVPPPGPDSDSRTTTAPSPPCLAPVFDLHQWIQRHPHHDAPWHYVGPTPGREPYPIQTPSSVYADAPAGLPSVSASLLQPTSSAGTLTYYSPFYTQAITCPELHPCRARSLLANPNDPNSVANPNNPNSARQGALGSDVQQAGDPAPSLPRKDPYQLDKSGGAIDYKTESVQLSSAQERVWQVRLGVPSLVQ
ncbi:hypothetical protein P7C70_g5709, partial [Phenoliferia sp. Uapishka_3]